MATSKTPPPEDYTERIVDIGVEQEMQEAFLEYAYSVIYSRALPDARDGLKPVQRRILFQMAEMGLRPDRAHVKSARVVGDVMGRLHPHGDAAIYDALVRLAQDFTLRVPLVDGHGNFGSLDDGPAAPRYTEVAARRLGPGHDGRSRRGHRRLRPQLRQHLHPARACCPSAIPNLLVNGASGIAVGMATNMPSHNLVEIVGAARHLHRAPRRHPRRPDALRPGPDLPTGGKIVGLEGIREAYATGRGSFRTRATGPDRERHRAPQGHRRHRAALHRSARRRSARRSRTSSRASGCRGSPTSPTSPTGSTACGWSSRSRTGSTRTRCSSSSTG